MKNEKKREIDFMGKAPVAIIFSAILIAFSIFEWINTGTSKYGIDFTGGSELIVRFSESLESESIAKNLKDAGVAEVIVQAFEANSNEYSLRVATEDTKAVTVLREGLEKKYQGKYTELASNVVGPVVGSELKKKGLIAFSLGLLVLLLYITFRFEFAFALGAVAAVFHDVIVCLGIYLALGYSLSMPALAAVLTIVGYSVNDTIVVFDRMREEMAKRKDYEVIKLMNECVNMTLSRTIITSLLTFFSALSLLVLGGGAIKDLSVFLVIGLISGTYSTIYIASPIAYYWDKFRNPLPVKEA